MSDILPLHQAPKPTEQPPLTRQPWQVLGVSKSSWYRITNRPQPIELGLPGTYYRVEDLLAWLKSVPPRRRRRQRRS